eukprot:15210928-Heterocapsa_arctica.AAC.1
MNTHRRHVHEAISLAFPQATRPPRLVQQGYPDIKIQACTLLEVVEGNNMIKAINTLRNLNNLFSHSFIHDTILVSICIP